MEKTEFITKAKKSGMPDALIQECLKYHTRLEKEGKEYPLENFFKFDDMRLDPDEIHCTYTDQIEALMAHRSNFPEAMV